MHLTFAAAQALQLSRSLGALGAMDVELAPVTAAPFRVGVGFPEAFHDPVRAAGFNVDGALKCMRKPGEWTAAMAKCNEALSAANAMPCDVELCWSSRMTRHHRMDVRKYFSCREFS